MIKLPKSTDEQFVLIDKRKIKITHPDRMLFPQSKISKGDMIDYYKRIAPVMIPHVKNRPVTMQRFPATIAYGFFQKDAPDYFPSWIKRIRISREDRSKIVSHVLSNNAATLVYLANQSVITQHLWLSKIDKLNYPDRLIFDFDPPSIKEFKQIIGIVKKCKILLEKLGLTPFVMTTGSKGLHVVVPIKRELLFDDVRAFARQIAQYLVEQYPDTLTIELYRNKRKGKIFVDYLRNAWAQTAVAPYSLRPKEGAPVATPLLWKELSTLSSSQKYNIKNIFKRITRIGDPWKDINKHAGSVKQAQKKLQSMKK